MLLIGAYQSAVSRWRDTFYLRKISDEGLHRNKADGFSDILLAQVRIAEHLLGFGNAERGNPLAERNAIIRVDKRTQIGSIGT